MTLQIGIYLFDEVEVLDFAGPYEVFSTASRVSLKKQLAPTAPFQVFTIAESLQPVRARAGLVVKPDYQISQHPNLDVLVVPGGVVTTELQRPQVIRWITQIATNTQLTASICTGAFLLAQAGLLQGKTVTTHWEDIDDLRTMFPDLTVQGETRWVDQDKIVTSAGISAGIDMSLHLVERLFSRELAQLTARQMEFDWQSQP